VTLFEPKRTASESTDQPAADDDGSNVSGGLRKIAMVVAIGGLAYLAIRRSRGEARSVERIRNRVAAAVETRGVRTDGSADSGQPEPGGVGVPSGASDGDSGSVEASESASGAETGETADESEPAGDERRADGSVDDEPVEGAETAVDEMDDAHEHPTEPGTMDVDRDVVEEAVDDEAVEDEDESTKEFEE